ncbi:hypothetical protein [Kitasatospora aureofaciens]|uniref:hypothetical protein n=1 Tax=Kitasatospora aureofaciens TaxID=1894 RepID=UPI0033EF147D
MRTASYDRYVRELALLAGDVASGRWAPVADDVHHALNGQAAGQLRELVPRPVRREIGAFFTGGELRASFAGLVGSRSRMGPFLDPTSGAGDLLLAASFSLPIEDTFEATVARWGRLLQGHDLEESFVQGARLRLVLAAAARHASLAEGPGRLTVPLDRAFPNLAVGDGLSLLQGRRSWGGHVLLNPPFGSVIVGDGCSWSSGRVTQAALFAEAAARSLKIGGVVTAILPDVLRSGSRYAAWRKHIEGMLDIERVVWHGQFDEHTDVDVFVLQGTRKRLGSGSAQVQWWPEIQAALRVGDRFVVRVGAVVDNRDPLDGRSMPYLTAHDMPTAGEMKTPRRRRRFAGATVLPPFVAIRRTSRPGVGSGGRSRIAGVLVTGKTPIAVDNHIITIRPDSGELRDCRGLLEVLDSPEVGKWLDERIRCRHMTVGVVRSIPWDDRLPAQTVTAEGGGTGSTAGRGSP